MIIHFCLILVWIYLLRKILKSKHRLHQPTKWINRIIHSIHVIVFVHPYAAKPGAEESQTGPARVTRAIRNRGKWDAVSLFWNPWLHLQTPVIASGVFNYHFQFPPQLLFFFSDSLIWHFWSIDLWVALFVLAEIQGPGSRKEGKRGCPTTTRCKKEEIQPCVSGRSEVVKTLYHGNNMLFGGVLW